ncbi:MAG: protein-glutamate O-methyltransferase CheR [Nitrospirae bacterium]|nr:protein-glutamate O-methyltransferase CheR [Nitrospirota bacterium]
MAEPALSEEHIDTILDKMYRERGWDFRRYRKSSLKRCIERRLAFSRLPYEHYINLLDAEPREFNQLFNQITIKVSEFFRDPEVFHKIEAYIIPETVERLKTKKQSNIRIWSSGCARGEEPYSLAILLSKAREKYYTAHNSSPSLSGFPCNIKIFATDIDEISIELARKGIYNETLLQNVPLCLKNHCFISIDNRYQIIPQIRNLVTFGVHNIVSNIHLSHIDIAICRNLLIYFEKDLQEKVIEKFWYSLDKGGFLILGKSEVIPHSLRGRFTEVFRKEKIYQKI